MGEEKYINLFDGMTFDDEDSEDSGDTKGESLEQIEKTELMELYEELEGGYAIRSNKITAKYKKWEKSMEKIGLDEDSIREYYETNPKEKPLVETKSKPIQSNEIKSLKDRISELENRLELSEIDSDKIPFKINDSILEIPKSKIEEILQAIFKMKKSDVKEEFGNVSSDKPSLMITPLKLNDWIKEYIEDDESTLSDSQMFSAQFLALGKITPSSFKEFLELICFDLIEKFNYKIHKKYFDEVKYLSKATGVSDKKANDILAQIGDIVFLSKNIQKTEVKTKLKKIAGDKSFKSLQSLILRFKQVNEEDFYVLNNPKNKSSSDEMFGLQNATSYLYQGIQNSQYVKINRSNILNIEFSDRTEKIQYRA